MSRLVSSRALALSTVLLLTACGGSSGPGTPTPTPSETPRPTTAPTPSGTAPSPSSTPHVASTVGVYFLHGERVQPVARTAHGAGVAAEAVRELLAGPTSAELAAGLTTTIPAGTALRGVTLRSGLATVDMSARFGSGGGSLSMTARVAQVVFTLTRFPGVERVAFRLDGRAVTSLGGEGIDLSRPVTRQDYEDLSPAVLIEQPLWAARVSSPIRATGTANVFEAVFFLEVRGTSGAVLVRKRVMATSGTGTRGTFDVRLPLTSATPGSATLVAFTYSAKDGSRHEEVRVPISISAP